MKTILLQVSSLPFQPILAQASLQEGASRALGIVMLIGFIFGTICVISGGFAIRRGDTDAGIGHRRTAVSTVGWIPGIERLASEPLPIRLALSLHAADPALRPELMPVNTRSGA